MKNSDAALSLRAAFFMLIASVVVFVCSTVVVNGGSLEAADRSLLLFLRSADNTAVLNGPPWLLYFMTNVTALGGWPLISLATIVLAGFLSIKRQWFYLALLLLIVVGETMLTSFLKDFFTRERPDVVLPLGIATSGSFPSGHSSSAASICIMLSFIAVEVLKTNALRYYIVCAALLTVVLVGLSRVFLGVHYLSDVIAGWSVGAAWASAVWLFMRPRKKIFELGEANDEP